MIPLATLLAGFALGYATHLCLTRWRHDLRTTVPSPPPYEVLVSPVIPRPPGVPDDLRQLFEIMTDERINSLPGGSA